MKPVNHDIWINKLRWKVANKGFVGMRELQLDCFRFIFLPNGLSQEQQELLMAFMGDSDHLNSLIPADFCNMFLKNKIKFQLKFTYSKKRGLKHSYCSFRIVREINAQLKQYV